MVIPVASPTPPHISLPSYSLGKRAGSDITVLPAGFEALELLDEEVLQDLGTLVEGRVAGVVVAAVVEDFGHVRHKLCQLDVLALM